MSKTSYGYTRIGLIEVGSRAVRYLVADFDINSRFSPVTIETYRHDVSPAGFQRGDIARINTLVERAFADLEMHNCEKSFVYGTEICRRMDKKYPNALSGKIRIVAPIEEAMASWAAGLLCRDNINDPVTCTVIDEGNGSTEIVRATWNGEIVSDVKFAGFKTGSAELLNEYRKSPNKYLQYLIEKVSEVAEVLRDADVRTTATSEVYLAGGVATKIAWISVRSRVDEHYKPHMVNGVKISVSHLLKLYSDLAKAYYADPRKTIQYIDSRRGSEDETPRIISSAPFLAKLRADVAPGDDVYVTGYGVRHGMAFLIRKEIISV